MIFINVHEVVLDTQERREARASYDRVIADMISRGMPARCILKGLVDLSIGFIRG